MRKYDYFWTTDASWYHWTEDGDRVVNSDAPREAQDSYKRYLEQKQDAAKRQKETMD